MCCAAWPTTTTKNFLNNFFLISNAKRSYLTSLSPLLQLRRGKGPPERMEGDSAQRSSRTGAGGRPHRPQCKPHNWGGIRKGAQKARTSVVWEKNESYGTSPAVQWLGLRTSNAGGAGSIPGRGTEIPHATGCGQKLKKKKKKSEPYTESCSGPTQQIFKARLKRICPQ